MRRGRDDAKKLEEAMRRAVAKALRESEVSKTAPPVAATGGDEEMLRGIPVLTRGVGGAIRGTRPGEGLK